MVGGVVSGRKLTRIANVAICQHWDSESSFDCADLRDNASGEVSQATGVGWAVVGWVVAGCDAVCRVGCGGWGGMRRGGMRWGGMRKVEWDAVGWDAVWWDVVVWDAVGWDTGG